MLRDFTYLAIFVMLAAGAIWVVTPRFGSRPGEAQCTAAQADIKNLEGAIEAFHADVGRYPTTEEGFGSLVESPTPSLSGWRGPYLKSVKSDPWGNPYQYVRPGSKGKAFDIISFGRDGKPGGGDDVSN